MSNLLKISNLAFSALLGSCSFILVSAFALPVMAQVQDGSVVQKPEVQQPVVPQKPKQTSMTFKELLAQIRNNDRKINDLYGNMPVGFPERQKATIAQIEQLTASTEKFKEQLTDVAIRSFKADPVGNTQAARVVYNLLSSKLNPVSAKDHFEPKKALELSKSMLSVYQREDETVLDMGYARLAYLGFRAAFANHDFDYCETLLDSIEKMGVDLDPMVRDKFKYSREAWKKESLQRRLETNTNDLPRVKFETSEGDFVVELYENNAPQTVANFVSLVERNFYNGLEFFVAKPGEYVRSGCSKNDGSTMPGYAIQNELGREKLRDHFAGTITMFNEGDGTAGSQFMICHQPNQLFDGKYTAFGYVKEGLDVIYRLNKVDRTKLSGGNASKIIKVTVVRKRGHEYKPKKLTVMK